MRNFIDVLVELSPAEWHGITTTMAWHYRTGVHRVHPKVRGAFKGQAPSKDEWDRIRKSVTAKRKADLAREARYVKAEQRDRRRVRMATYMRKYRAQQKEKRNGRTETAPADH